MPRSGGRTTSRLNSRQRLAAVVLALVAVCFATLDIAGGDLRNAHSGARGLLGGLYRGTDSVLGPARRFVQGLPNVSSNQATIDKLRRQNIQLQQQLAASSADADTDAQLAKLRLAATSDGFTIAPARVIAFGPAQGFDWTATVDVGASSGLAVDQTVTDGAGLVGRVLHVDASTSVILLAADPGSGVGVRDTRTGELAIATGAGTDGFTLSPLDPTTDLRVGDMVTTGPAGQSTFAAGLQVGTITSVRVSSDGTTTATVRPTVSPTAIDLVGVIIASTPQNAPRAAITAPGATVSNGPTVSSATGSRAAGSGAAGSSGATGASSTPSAQAAGH